jgi:cytochrome c556
MMDIDKAFEQFIEFPDGSNGKYVTTASAKFFADYCTENLQEENERLQADVERLRAAGEQSDNILLLCDYYKRGISDYAF